MKKIAIIIMLLAVSFAAQAQYANTHVAQRRGERIKLDGQMLSRSESAILMSDLAGEDYSAQWKNARGWRSAGIGMIAGGAVIMVGGLTTTMVGAMTSALGAGIGAAAGATAGAIGGPESSQSAGSQGARAGAQAGKPIMTGGLIATLVGLGIHIAGVPILVVNCTKMSHMVDQYNEISIGPSPSGVGLVLNF